ncbi:LytR/AlgR family response regulator transcription factor [Candidatus Thiodictyon syntrophicum]|jgi:two-component system response regulator AlgR|uniref:DNA-binding response regulator n=1 Tax=Candidatus Thiodictyon syntrophicum TaxID=1166950 RepID=A0A2K8UA05_9GAMM|nr:LytTR family DNA-binding domain-containing protein [Candidatus Thiodictyon syntrophicum]AUB82420.1 DNA-binding response regulator [Candidatus Thiodictyon syntrophicum]
MKILVVDDESPARQRLVRLLSEIQGNYELAGEASDGIEAVQLCRSTPVDLVLMDVQMPGLNGLDAARQISHIEPPPAVILVTAYEQYALAAFERKVEDYLVKPVRRERLQEALERARIPTRPQRAALATRDEAHPGRRLSLSAHYRGGLQTVPIEDIIFLQAEHKYVTVRHTGGELLVDESLKALEDEFEDLFLRIHRNALVARSRLFALEKGTDGGTEVRLRDCPERLPVSRRHLADIRRWLRAGTP